MRNNVVLMSTSILGGATIEIVARLCVSVVVVGDSCNLRGWFCNLVGRFCSLRLCMAVVRMFMIVVGNLCNLRGGFSSLRGSSDSLKLIMPAKITASVTAVFSMAFGSPGNREGIIWLLLRG